MESMKISFQEALGMIKKAIEQGSTLQLSSGHLTVTNAKIEKETRLEVVDETLAFIEWVRACMQLNDRQTFHFYKEERNVNILIQSPGEIISLRFTEA